MTDQSKEKAPEIILPEDEDIVSRLRKKLEEYQRRLNDNFPGKDPYDIIKIKKDASYKSEILKVLLEKGRVNTHEISMQIHKKDGYLDADLFDIAAGVIDNYCNRGGMDCIGGTPF